MSEREIQRPVTVADDSGAAKQFAKGAVPEGTSEVVYGRLERAGAFGDRPLASSGGAGIVGLSGVNPITATATAEIHGETEGQSDAEVRFAAEGDSADAGEAGDNDLSDASPEPDLDEMTKAELVDYAKARGITIDPSKSKADILAAIKAA
ncbi:hypothetical protein [Aureimonas sp. AU40]|uniref:hypothetical protein n=1 Tax=Aureimonas sp. AU40 TaxID=1637747 RepID=UPI0007819567|nr:hypothetical protein [Aureimonas sp. AU40]